jgi:hypothetical protein
MTDPFITLIAEARRYLAEDAGGDQEHPGFRLRVLLLLTVADDLQWRVVARVVSDAGFFPMPDVFDPDAGLSRCSMASAARAVGVSEVAMASEVAAFLGTEIAGQLGFSFETLFPSGENECALH